MGYLKNKQIEERELEDSYCFDVKVEEKEAMEIFFKEMDNKAKLNKLNRFADLSVLFLVAFASFLGGAMLIRVLVEVLYGRIK